MRECACGRTGGLSDWSGMIGKPLARSAEREPLPYGFPELSVKSPKYLLYTLVQEQKETCEPIFCKDSQAVAPADRNTLNMMTEV